MRVFLSSTLNSGIKHAIFLVISAITSGCEGWQDIEYYGEEKLDWLRKYRPFVHGIPRRHTIARILRSVVAETLLEALSLWINEQRTSQNRSIIAFDGKVLRGSYRNDKKTALQYTATTCKMSDDSNSPFSSIPDSSAANS